MMDAEQDLVLVAAQQAWDDIFHDRPGTPGVITKALIVFEAIDEDGDATINWAHSRELSEWDAEGMVRFYLRRQAAHEVASMLEEGD